MSRERPILFSGPMVRAILAGRKTQTRRVIKPRYAFEIEELEDGSPWPWHPDYVTGGEWDGWVLCPYGQLGDRLWVRETWADLLAVSPATDEPMPIGPGERLIEPPTSWTDEKGRTRWHYDGKVIAYRANSDIEFCDGDGFCGEFANRDDMPRWRPSIHMPRWASRITLEVAGVRAERLQDISTEDCIAEGIEPSHTTIDGRQMWKVYPHEISDGTAHGERLKYVGKPYTSDPRESFVSLWLSINGPGSWDTNPWVWCISFQRTR